MTKENHQSVALEEITNIQFTCVSNGCRARVSIPSNGWDKLPRNCPSCLQAWWYENPVKEIESVESALNHLQNSIRQLIKYQRERKKEQSSYVGCAIRLEIMADDQEHEHAERQPPR
jgi:hypothetical protein